jgi:hypothetical protein
MCLAQHWLRTDFGAKFSLYLQFGTHEKAIGAGVNGFASIQNVQLNGSYSFRFMKKNLGSRCDFSEQRFGFGGVLRGGQEQNTINIDWDGALHQSKHPISLGYSYYWYIDPVGTSQHSGAWNLGIKRVDILFENDVFGGKGLDKYRTGALIISYRDSIQKASLGLKMWTGETNNSTWDKTPRAHQPSGYRDITQLPYGYLNHGIVFCGYHRQLFLNQNVGFKVGVDSEFARHIFQNRISHDLILLPKSVKRHTPHYPMLNEKGEIVFSKKEARKSLIYSQFFIGETVY